jgi:hypothetical protein
MALEYNAIDQDDADLGAAMRDYAMANTNSGGSDFFGTLDQFSGLVTKTASTIGTLAAQADGIANLQAQRDLARLRTQQQFNLGKTALDIETIRSQRELALAQAGLSGIKTTFSSQTVLLIGALLAFIAYSRQAA